MKNEIFYQEAQELRNLFPSLTNIICEVMKVIFSNNDVFPDKIIISGHRYSLEDVSFTINRLAPKDTKYKTKQNGDYFFAKKIP